MYNIACGITYTDVDNVGLPIFYTKESSAPDNAKKLIGLWVELLRIHARFAVSFYGPKTGFVHSKTKTVKYAGSAFSSLKNLNQLLWSKCGLI